MTEDPDAIFTKDPTANKTVFTCQFRLETKLQVIFSAKSLNVARGYSKPKKTVRKGIVKVTMTKTKMKKKAKFSVYVD